MKALFLWIYLFSFAAFAEQETVSLSFSDFKIEPEKQFKELPEDYLSVAIDMALVVGAGWWEGNQEFKNGRGGKNATPLDFKNKDLIKYYKALGMMSLRIGGTEADSVYYQLDEEKKPEKFGSVLSAKRFLEIDEFLKAVNGKLFLTLNAGPANWDKENSIKLSQTKKIVKFVKKHNISIEAFEFGNENNAFWVAHGIGSQLSTSSYASNYLKTRKYLKQEGFKLAGPANAFWPRLGEVAGFFTVSSFRLFKKIENKLDVFTWHYYPSQSQRCPFQVVKADKENFLSLKTHQRIEDSMLEIKKYRDKFSPTTPIWLGETGSAQCGGEQGVSDGYLSSLWWLNQLALGALHSTEKQIRQSFVGGDYALLDPESFQPRSDYFASLLWKRLMGRKFFKMKSPKKEILSYAHCQKKTSGKMIQMLINFGKSLSLNFNEKTEIIKIEGIENWRSMAMNSVGLKSLEDFDQAFQFKKVKKLDFRSGEILFIRENTEFCK